MILSILHTVYTLFFKDMDTFIQQGQIKIVETIKNYKITKMCTF